MLFQLFCIVSARCQITSSGSGAWLSPHLSGIFPDSEKKVAWERRARKGSGLDEHFKCWNRLTDAGEKCGIEGVLPRMVFSRFSKQVRSFWIPIRCWNKQKELKIARKLNSCSLRGLFCKVLHLIKRLHRDVCCCSCTHSGTHTHTYIYIHTITQGVCACTRFCYLFRLYGG